MAQVIRQERDEAPDAAKLRLILIACGVMPNIVTLRDAYALDLIKDSEVTERVEKSVCAFLPTYPWGTDHWVTINEAKWMAKFLVKGIRKLPQDPYEGAFEGMDAVAIIEA